MLQVLTYALPIATGGAALFATSAFWDASKQALLVSLSVIAAGVLVRLARGLPFANIDHFEVDELRQLTRSIDNIFRALRALVVVIFFTMSLLIVSPVLFQFIHSYWLDQNIGLFFASALSGILGLLIGYIGARMLYVVQIDHNIVTLQSKFTVRAAERRLASQFDSLEKKSSMSSFRNPDNYGARIQ